MKQYLVKEETLLEILRYFATKPYAEVFKLVPKLQVPEVEEVPEKVEATEEK